jgi:predicted O-linked N-acetylglucosamine transferase (SPINDLY family)
MPIQSNEPSGNVHAAALPIERDRVRKLSTAELFTLAESLKKLQQREAIVSLYKTWIAFNPNDSSLFAAYFNYGVALRELPDLPGAINAMRECIRLKPDFLPPYINLGRILEDSGEPGLGVAEWLEAIGKVSIVNGETVTHKLFTLTQIGRVLENLQNDSAAEDALKQCLDISLRDAEVIQHWIFLRQRQCKWPVIVGSERNTKEKLIARISPLSLANMCDDPMFQLANAFHFGKQSIGIPKADQLKHFAAVAMRKRSGKLRIGYVSSDLREHAVGFAMTEVTELHDRENFEIFAYYCGIDRIDPTQTRIRNAVDHWIDISPLTDEQAASKIVEDEIDILVDLNGYTKFARTRIFSLRPAPIIVNWFGFPGTMGTPYHHYLIADPHIIPEDLEIYYSEKVVRLPCYQPNDRKRDVSTNSPTRKDAQLPEDAFVYCSLNGTQKLTARTFQRWMTILAQVPDSVLWLLTGTSDTNARLQQYAERHGVAPERVIFAERKANPEHLARYRLADVFLDNFPYGAHTTAADALWMGVPVLTFPGRSFASRVCASVVHAAGIGEMVCATAEAYVSLGIELGRDRNKLTAIKSKLVASRGSCVLFDTTQHVRHLEDLFRRMWLDFEQGKLPIPNLDNLDVYHEIALDMDFDSIELLTNDAYQALYREKLTNRHNTYPIRFDARLWRPGI